MSISCQQNNKINKGSEMNKSSSSQPQNNPQIILAHGPAPDLPSIESDTFILANKNVKQRTNSTEGTKYMFGNSQEGGRQSMNRNAVGSNQLTFQSSSDTNNQQHFQHRIPQQQQRGQVSSSANYQNMIQKDISIYGGQVVGEGASQDKSTEKQYSLQQRQQRGQDMTSPGQEYQSTLLTRYLKEPKLPPSSTYYNNLSRKKKSAAVPSRGSSKPQASLTQNGFGAQGASSTQYKESSSPAKLMPGSEASKSRKRVIGYTGQPASQNSNVISYRNQKEIMRKIFGNEQNYHQVKNLLVKGPYSTEENSGLMQKTNTFQRPQDLTKSPLAAKSTNYGESFPRQQSEKPHSSNLKSTGLERRQGHQERQPGNQTPSVGPDETYLAKSIKRDNSAKFGENQTAGASTQHTNIPSHSAQQLPMHSDQVEKAIFDLQDVKNNYFQEKTTYDQKIQQIQNKTLTNGFGVNPNATAYNKTATSGFLPAGQRPLTQGGNNLLRNQQLMTDNNILKGDLDQVSKEDLKERLVVAEMVMKKLFQRNRDLEDQVQSAKESHQTIEPFEKHADISSLSQQQNAKRLSISNMASPKNLTELNNFDITTDEGDKRECPSCIKLNRELTIKETDYQDRINELHQQLLKKTEVLGKSSHLEYLQIRMEETMTEAKRHFANYINARDTLTSFMESRLNQSQLQGGVKGQKIHHDILTVLKKNLEAAELALIQEKDQIKLSYAKNQAHLLKKDALIKKKDAKLKALADEIERRRFIESKVQRYVKGLICKNQRYGDFLSRLASTGRASEAARKDIEAFQRELEMENEVGGQDGGESTENEEDADGNESMSNRNISVEVNDL